MLSKQVFIVGGVVVSVTVDVLGFDGCSYTMIKHDEHQKVLEN
jgi:hypothetical protein